MQKLALLNCFQSRLSTASSPEQLASIRVLDKMLTNYLEEWGAQANKLGQLEDEKAKLTPSAPDTSPREVDARNKWIRSVNALIANAALTDLDSATDHLIFGGDRVRDGSNRFSVGFGGGAFGLRCRRSVSDRNNSWSWCWRGACAWWRCFSGAHAGKGT